MSFNVSTRLNNLSLQVQQLTASSVANPLTSNLNCASKDIINIDTLSSSSGLPLILDAGSNQVSVNSAMQINNQLNIVNSTVNNSLVVADSSGGDTSCFVVDASGNVGVKVNPVTALTSDFTVNGGVSVSGDISCTNINASNVVNSVSVGSSGLSISGTAQNPTINNTGVTQLTAGTGITLSGSTGNVTISAPATGTLTGITAGTGIQVSGSAPSPTVSNTGVLSLTAGNNMLVSAPSGNVILAAKVARPLSFTVAGVRSGFPINTSAYGNQPLSTLTSFGDLLAGVNEFIGVNTGTVIMDLTGYCLATVSGQAGNYNVYITKVGSALPGLLVQSIQPSYPQGSTQDVIFNLGLCSFSLADFRTLYGTGASNAFIDINILNQNVNQVFPAGNAVNYIAWYYPDSTI